MVSMSMLMGIAMISGILAGALLLDALIGDPRRLHPVVGLGNLATLLEKITRRGLPPVLAGALTALALPTISGGLAFAVIYALSLVPGTVAMGAGSGALLVIVPALLAALVVSFCIATRSLAEHTGRVLADLEAGDLAQARQSTAMIVGRDTAALNESELVRATVECLAESISDGITAPLIYAAAGGVVGGLLWNYSVMGADPASASGPAMIAASAALGAVAYRAINTMDSMFGYRNERYLLFGRVPARLDDLANLLPARLSAIAVVIAAALPGLPGLRAGAALRYWWRDGLQHSSPNAGQCEAAFAGALGVALGGPATYQGRLIDKPQLGEALRPLVANDIRTGRRLMVAGVLVCVLLLIVALLLVGLAVQLAF